MLADGIYTGSGMVHMYNYIENTLQLANGAIFTAATIITSVISNHTHLRV